MTAPLTPELRRAIVRRFGQIGLLILAQAVGLFAAAGKWNWWEGWVYMMAYLAFIAANTVLMLPRNVALVAERSQVQPDAKRWDLWIGRGLTLFSASILIVVGLDERWGWSAPMGLAAQVLGLVGIRVGDALFSWAMATNSFFSTVVRIQKERGHTVVTTGPYRFVRHPGYSGMFIATLSTPLLFSSAWAFLPALGLIVIMVIRTALDF